LKVCNVFEELTKVVLEWVSDITLNKSTWQGVAILVASRSITIFREETDVVTLCADHDSPLDLFKVRIAQV
jgi:hypothetical protein